MKRHTMNIQSRWFESIKEGLKRYEVRIFRDKFKDIMIGDEIEFNNIDNNEKITKTVKFLFKLIDYQKPFERMVELFDYRMITPGVTGIEECISIYNSIPGYESGSLDYGIVIFHI